MPLVGDVAGQRHDLRPPGERGPRLLERGGSAGIDHEPPAAVGEGLGERAAEAARGAGDQGGRHDAEATPARAAVAIGNWA